MSKARISVSEIRDIAARQQGYPDHATKVRAQAASAMHKGATQSR